jgi:hypothetical protein
LKKPDEIPGTRVASKGITSELSVSTIVPGIYDGNGRDEINFAGASPNKWMSCTSPSVDSTVKYSNRGKKLHKHVDRPNLYHSGT